MIVRRLSELPDWITEPEVTFSIFGGRGGYAGSIIGALMLTVLNSLLTLLDAPEPFKQILYGSIILLLAAAYTRLTE